MRCRCGDGDGGRIRCLMFDGVRSWHLGEKSEQRDYWLTKFR